MQYIAPQDLKSFGLIPEIIGRLPVLTYLNPFGPYGIACYSAGTEKFHYQAIY